MKNHSNSLFKAIFCILFFSQSNITFGQTTLTAGDIAFTGYISGNGDATLDEFTFVLLKNITANTVIKFTDRGWLRTGPTTGSFNVVNVESVDTWTSNAAYAAGTEIRIINTTATFVNQIAGTSGAAGTVVGTGTTPVAGSGLSLSTSGDQIIAYQGTEASPIFISAIHMNVYINGIPQEPITTDANWDGAYDNTNASGLPAGLTTGLNAIWIGTQGDINFEYDNAHFVCAGNLSTVANIKALIFDKTKWAYNGVSPNFTANFTLPTLCNYVSNLPAVFTTQPTASSLCASLSATFNVVTDQSGVSFQWQEASDIGFASPTNITTGGLFTVTSTTNSSSLKISDNTTKNGKFYRCVATNSSALISNSNIVALTTTNNTFPTGNISATAAIGTGNSSYIFASGCRLLGKIVPGNISGNINVEHWLEASVPTVAGVPFVKRHYQITPDAGTSGTITLYFTQADFDSYNSYTTSTLDNLPTSAADAVGKANLRITKYNGSSNDFTGLPASYTNGSEIIDPADANIFFNAGVTPGRWEITFPVTSFSGFTVAGATSVPLPVKIASFSGKINAERLVQLNWKVSEQIDIQYYEIEKSLNAKNFEPIGKLLANNTTFTEYQYLDAEPQLGTNYYRLKTVEMDGKINYSKMISVEYENETTHLVYPNPSTQFLKIENLPKSAQKIIEIFDSKGALVKTISLAGAEFLDISDLKKGLYILKIPGRKSIKFLKE